MLTTIDKRLDQIRCVQENINVLEREKQDLSEYLDRLENYAMLNAIGKTSDEREQNARFMLSLNKQYCEHIQASFELERSIASQHHQLHTINRVIAKCGLR